MAILLVIAIVLDRLSKAIVGSRSDFFYSVIENFFSIEHSLNMNGPLGLHVPSGLLFALAIVVIFSILILAVYEVNYTRRILLLMVLAGVLSNSIDRWSHGYVIDIFNFSFGLIFNIADLMIVFGVLALLLKHAHESRV